MLNRKVVERVNQIPVEIIPDSKDLTGDTQVEIKVLTVSEADKYKQELDDKLKTFKRMIQTNYRRMDL